MEATPRCAASSLVRSIVKSKTVDEMDGDTNASKMTRLKKSQTFSRESSSSKSLSAVGSFGKIGGCGSGRIAANNGDWVDKP